MPKKSDSMLQNITIFKRSFIVVTVIQKLSELCKGLFYVYINICFKNYHCIIKISKTYRYPWLCCLCLDLSAEDARKGSKTKENRSKIGSKKTKR